jgi:hypothetical protein
MCPFGGCRECHTRAGLDWDECQADWKAATGKAAAPPPHEVVRLTKLLGRCVAWLEIAAEFLDDEDDEETIRELIATCKKEAP